LDLPAAHKALVEALERLRGTDGGWPYLRGRKSRLESTCWAALGAGVALASTPLTRWTTSRGLLADPAGDDPNFAFNALAALVAMAEGATAMATQIASALVEVSGEVVPPSPAIRIDTSLAGWSWSSGTFTWVEPTAWCMLAVKQIAAASPAVTRRIVDAEKVMRDRACRGGGWNYGNSEVMGQLLSAHVPTTAVGILSLQDASDKPYVADAIRFLEREALTEPSTTALALSALALAAVDQPAGGVIDALVAHTDAAIAFGNAAALGMAAHALACARSGRPSAVFALTRVQA
jgi:hypothetical protein